MSGTKLFQWKSSFGELGDLGVSLELPRVSFSNSSTPPTFTSISKIVLSA